MRRAQLSLAVVGRLTHSLHLPDRFFVGRVEEKREEFRKDIDIAHLASELVVDAVVPGHALRDELIRRLALYAAKTPPRRERKHAVHPV